ncbi:MAG: molecular chaperone [Clostridia bacterium]|nr:molecular chaperone [Clostridia bacterium]
MRKCKLTKYEKETIVLFNEAENTANVYTYNTALKNRLAKFSKENPSCAKLITEYPCGAVAYEVDKKRLSIRFTAPYSEERREKARKYAKAHNIVSNLNSRHFKR